MNHKRFLLFFILFLLSNANNAFNITSLLDKYPAFSTFNSYLTQTGLADTINSRRTITTLVVDNDNISPLSGKPADKVKSIMSVHVVLDYYDVKRLQNLKGRRASLTTLFQTSGQAGATNGFLNVTDTNTGSVVFGSAGKDGTLGATLVKSILAQPYNLSILQISTVIVPQDINNAPSKAPAISPGRSRRPAKPPSRLAPSNATSPAPSNATSPAAADTPSTSPDKQSPGSAPKGSDSPPADSGGFPSIHIDLQFSVSVLLTAMCLLLAF